MKDFFFTLIKVSGELVKFAAGVLTIYMHSRKVAGIFKRKRKTASSTSRSSNPTKGES